MSNPALIDLEGEVFLGAKSPKRRALEVSRDTVAMTLLAMRSDPSTVSTLTACPLRKPHLALKLKCLGTLECNPSSITDDEDESTKSKTVAFKKVTTTATFGHPLTQPALLKPTLVTSNAQRCPMPMLLPVGKPLPPAPRLATFLVSPTIMPLTSSLL